MAARRIRSETAKVGCGEGGFRVPFIARWPKQIAAGTETSEIATAMDLLPTLCRLADAKLQTAGPIDGRDIWPLLSDPAATSPHEAFYYYHTNRLHAIRMGQWKLRLINPDEAGDEIVDAEAMSLYDLHNDIGEAKSVLLYNRPIADQINRAADDIRRQLGDEITGWPGSERRVAGRTD